MDRVNGANWVDIGGGNRGFRDEDVMAGVTGTDVPAAWLNALQENVLTVIEKEGLAGDIDDWELLWKALQIARAQSGAYRSAEAFANDPPGAPQAGKTWIVGAAPTGAWVGHEDELAEWSGTGWAFVAPTPWMLIGLADRTDWRWDHTLAEPAWVHWSATEQIAGPVRKATAEEVGEGIADNRYVAPVDLQSRFADVLSSGNMLINAGFDINQEEFAGGVVAAGDYAIDGWGAPSGGAAADLSFANGVATISAGRLKQVVEDPGSALGDITLTWSGSALASIDGSVPAASPVSVNHGGGPISVEFTAGTVTRPMLALGDNPVPFRAWPRSIEKLRCHRFFFKNTDDLDHYVPSNAAIYYGLGFRYYIPFPTSMRVPPVVTITSYEIADRAGSPPNPRSDFAGVTIRVDVAAGNGIVAVANVRFTADARLAL
ncbi:MAG: DUF2793 domain-containing protein [Oricola sp.]|jgi:hypothetical protein|nr:MAG: DUF2793 domain-containing protein [Oricola sp.]